MFKILEIKGKAYFYTLIHCHVCNFFFILNMIVQISPLKRTLLSL